MSARTEPIAQSTARALRPRVLVIEPRPDALRAFERLLKLDSLRWQQVFVHTFEQAFAVLESAPTDVVVVSLDPSRLDDVMALERLKFEHPDVIRLVFGAPTTKANVIRIAPLCHQYLMKPTDTIRLRDTLDRALSVRDLLIQPALRTAVGGTETLPSPPPVIIELRSAMSDRATDAARVAQIVEQDAALVAKLLQLANSAFFGSSRRYAAGTVVSIHEAVVILGLNVVEQLALVTGIFGAFDGQEKALGLSANDLRRHATLVADIASNFMTSRRYAEEAYFAGILHDVGKLVLASRFPAAYTRVVERHKRGEGSVADLETEQFGASHAEVGGFLLACWGLPRIVVEAVAYHHRPSVLGRTHFDAVGAVHIAEAMAQDFEEAIPIGTLELESRLDAVYMEASGANERMRAFREIAADVVRRN